MAAIDDLDDLAQGCGYESMWQAREAINASSLDDTLVDAINDGIGRYAVAVAENNPNLARVRRGVENAMEAIHAGQPGLSARLIAAWRNPNR